MAATAVVVAAILIADHRDNVLAGQASVIDGGTIRIADQKVRLQGLAAPALAEPGGIEARNAMIELVKERIGASPASWTAPSLTIVWLAFAVPRARTWRPFWSNAV